MLDVHPPHHAANTWRDFLVHIATIVVGLLIAIGLEQTVEYIHHRREVAETRRLLREEREQNRRNFAANTAGYRYQVAILQNDRLVLNVLRQHPGTAEQDLPGILIYSSGYEPAVESAWKTASANGVTQYMDRQEVENLSHLYRLLETADADEAELWRATNIAAEYAFNDPNIAHFTAAQIAEQVKLTDDCAAINFRWAVTLENIQESFPDFDAGPSQEELSRNREDVRNAEDAARISDARAQTHQRLDATRKNYLSLAQAAEKR
jgi:hypothetical protein